MIFREISCIFFFLFQSDVFTNKENNSFLLVTLVAYIDFPWFTDYINNSIIPRNIGGLAETIDVTESNHVSEWTWSQGDVSNPEIGFFLVLILTDE